MDEARYQYLWKVVRHGRPGNMKMADYQKLEKEFRTSAPKCNDERECNSCPNKNICWF